MFRFFTELAGIADTYVRTAKRLRHALFERILRMAYCEIIMRVWLRHLSITAVIGFLRIVALMAVMMVGHVRMHIRLIVVQINGFRLLVITRPISIIIRR
jgi:hypothetical protein